MLIRQPRNRSGEDPGRKGTGSTPGRALGKLAGAGLLSLLIAVSSATPTPRRIEVTARRFSFEPAEITVKSGESVELVITSSDVPHGLRIRELNVNVRASKGKPGDAKFTPEKEGTFIGHCSVFCGAGHGKMTLTIHVVS